MLQRIQSLGRGQRLLIFILLLGAGLVVIIVLSALLILSSFENAQRDQSVSLLPNVTVAEYAALPDDDAYPAALAVAPDGTVYTGSYQTGALWAIDPAGVVTEVPGVREAVGAVAGLTVAPDGVVYIVDQFDSDYRTSGGVVWRLAPGEQPQTFAAIRDARGFVTPDDAALDSQGRLYVSDRGRDEVWRFDADGQGELWWTPRELPDVTSYDATGLAYDPASDALLITDGLNDTLYRVSVADPADSERLYWHQGRPNAPGFDGLTLAPDGTIYIAALGQRGIARYSPPDDLAYVAGLFRAPSDVDFLAPNRLIVSNFDSFSLVVQAVRPALPFALDVVTLGE